MLLFGVIYCLLALLVYVFIGNNHKSAEQYYKVEINHIMSELSTMEEDNIGGNLYDKTDLFNNLDISQYKNIKYIDFLDGAETEKEKVEKFYRGINGMNSTVRPLYLNGSLVKYVRFDYRVDFTNDFLLLGVELVLFIMAFFSLVMMFYLKRHLVAPFHSMRDLAYDLSKGNLHTEVKAEKNQYLGKFLWGINQLKDALYVTRKRELELLKEKKLLLFSLSHDIKTPINTIKLYSKALQEGLYTSKEKQMQAYRQIGEKAENIEKYVGEIVKASGEDLIHIQVEKGEYYLGDLMRKIISVYGEQCSRMHCELMIGDFQDRLYQGDFNRLLEVFENLFENAFKYGDGRRIEISFYEEDYCQLIRVFNTGQSVAQNDFAHLFDSFYRGENTNGRQGSGLGLYICREIMHKSGGEIFANVEEEGMAFTIVLPM